MSSVVTTTPLGTTTTVTMMATTTSQRYADDMTSSISTTDGDGKPALRANPQVSDYQPGPDPQLTHTHQLSP